MFNSSLTDTRGELLDAYKVSATLWDRDHAKVWDTASFKFQAGTTGGTIMTMPGAAVAADEDVRDSPQSGESSPVPAT